MRGKWHIILTWRTGCASIQFCIYPRILIWRFRLTRLTIRCSAEWKCLLVQGREKLCPGTCYLIDVHNPSLVSGRESMSTEPHATHNHFAQTTRIFALQVKFATSIQQCRSKSDFCTSPSDDGTHKYFYIRQSTSTGCVCKTNRLFPLHRRIALEQAQARLAWDLSQIQKVDGHTICCTLAHPYVSIHLCVYASCYDLSLHDPRQSIMLQPYRCGACNVQSILWDQQAGLGYRQPTGSWGYAKISGRLRLESRDATAWIRFYMISCVCEGIPCQAVGGKFCRLSHMRKSTTS